MKELLALQNNFQHYLLMQNDDFSQHVVGTEKVPVEIRLAIYGNAYRSRLIDALAANFPVMAIYFGDEQFADMASCYIDAYPSTFRSIRWFGDQLETFLAEDLDYSQYPILAELAKLEWLMTLTFDAEESEIADFDAVTSVRPENWADMRFRLHPSVYLCEFSWNAVQIWQQLMEDEAPNDPLQSEKPVRWVFWRKELTNQFCSLPEDEAFALDAAKNGLNFGDICEGLCQWIDESQAAQRAASLLKGWISSGLIAEIY